MIFFPSPEDSHLEVNLYEVINFLSSPSVIVFLYSPSLNFVSVNRLLEIICLLTVPGAETTTLLPFTISTTTAILPDKSP